MRSHKTNIYDWAHEERFFTIGSHENKNIFTTVSHKERFLIMATKRDSVLRFSTSSSS